MLIRRLRYWLQSTTRRWELREEMELHIAETAAELEEQGWSRSGAQTEARRRFGNTTRVAENAREVWLIIWLEQLKQDVACSFRTLRRTPGFLIASSLILSLGIGVNLAAFQLIDGVFWKPPEIRDPVSLVRLFHANSRGQIQSGRVPYPAAVRVAESNTAFAAVLLRSEGAITQFNDIHYGLAWGDDPSNRPKVSFVSANWFDELGFGPVIGRTFHEGTDDVRDSSPGVVVSERFWRKTLGEDPDIVGQTVHLGTQETVVVGVVPSDVMPHNDTMIWLPITQIEYYFPGIAFRTSWDPALSGVQVYGRLPAGLSRQVVREMSRGWVSELASQWPDLFDPGDFLDPIPASANFMTPRERRDARDVTLIGTGLALLILIVACSNLLNLALTRSVSREREFSLRVALGASRWRVMRQVLGESSVLVVISTITGLVVVYWAFRAFIAFADMPGGLPDMSYSWRTIAGALGIAGIAITVIGLFPAWKASRTYPAAALRDGGSQMSAAHTRKRLGRVLVGVQVAGSGLLLVLTGLVVHSLQRVSIDSQDFDIDNVVIVTAPLQRRGIADTDAASYWQDLWDFAAGHSQTAAAAFVSRSPLETGSMRLSGDLEGVQAAHYEVGPEYFQVMQIPILAGRTFDVMDAPGSSVIVSRRLAELMYGELNVLGLGYPKSAPTATVIGLAEDVRLTTLEGSRSVDLYAPFNPASADRALILRARSDAATMLRSIWEAARSWRGPVAADVHLLSADFTRGGDQRALSWVFGILGGLALAISSIGVFGVTAYQAALRRKEIAVRQALGAGRRRLVLVLVQRLLWPLLAGLFAGLPAGVFLGGLFAGPPIFIQPFDPPVLVIVATILMAATAIAAVLPAWQSLAGDVVSTLRSE